MINDIIYPHANPGDPHTLVSIAAVNALKAALRDHAPLTPQEVSLLSMADNADAVVVLAAAVLGNGQSATVAWWEIRRD